MVDPVKEADKESEKFGSADFASAARERLKRKAIAPEEAGEAKLDRVKKASLSFAGAEDDF